MSHLEEILRRKQWEVAEARVCVPEAELLRQKRAAPPARGFAQALSLSGGPLRVIAEVKRASPSAGAIRADLDPVAMARAYAAGGAAAISVLTDGPGFGGSLKDLEAVRGAVSLPLLRKDFVIDPYQLLEARVVGADAALLIVAALARPLLEELLAAAAELGLDALVEVHDAAELETALACKATVVGINNRDLASFRVDLATSESLLARVPTAVRAVAESGIKTAADVRRLRAAGAANLLVGEALVRAPDAGALLREWAAT